jgi:acetoacetate decarboxylase
MKYGYGKEPELARQYLKGGALLNQEGIYVGWETTPEAIKDALPPCLTPGDKPYIFSYIVYNHDTTFSPAYMEAGIGHPCSYNGIPGLYFFSFFLSGDGALMGTFMGRDGYGIPKKIAEDIQITRDGDEVKAHIVRNGIKLMDVNIDLTKEYNSTACSEVIGMHKPGDESCGGAFFFKYDINQTDNFDSSFSNLRIVQNFTQCEYKQWEPGSVEIAMQPSMNDPWSSFEVVRPLGASYAVNSQKVEKSDVYPVEYSDEIMATLITGRYDMCSFGKPLIFFK